jgi:EAL domain-containing protein (putative c-di-GMP-specific phosphodiesterase class I)
MRLANDLRRALDNEELVLHYQPLVELASGRIRGAEALVRWNHPDLGMLPPDEFISVAEKTGLIVPLGLFVLRRACEQYAALRDKAAPDGDFTMSVNLSGVQLSCTTLADDIAAILRETNVPPHALKLEITETAAMTSPDHARELFTKLRQQGITIAIDDFGTGYSSLSHLHSFPVDTLKIDRSFVSGLAEAHNTTPIIRAVVALGHSLGMSIIAEGVEGADQRELLSGLRCEYGQGFFFSRPVPFEKFGE